MPGEYPSVCTFEAPFGGGGDTTLPLPPCSVTSSAGGGDHCCWFPLMLLLPGSSAPPTELGGKSSTQGCSQTERLVRCLPSDTGLKVTFILLLKSPLWWLKFHPFPSQGPHTHPWPANIRVLNRQGWPFLMWHSCGTAGLLFNMRIFLWLHW